MLYHEQSDDYRPLFWMQGHPIYANTLIVIAHVVSFVVCALCLGAWGATAVIENLALIPPSIWPGFQLWRLFSYAAFDPGFFSQRSLWFLFSIILLYFFGREVEQFVGRRTYLKFYAALILIPGLLFSVAGLFLPLGYYLNCGDVIFGVFVAFATIYPGAMPSFWLPLSARMLMWILLGISTLLDYVAHDAAAIFMLWACTAVGFFGMRLVGAGSGGNWLVGWLEDRRMQRLAKRQQLRIVQERKVNESTDAILEKISKFGVQSLDARERAALERARTNLLKRDRR